MTNPEIPNQEPKQRDPRDNPLIRQVNFNLAWGIEPPRVMGPGVREYPHHQPVPEPTEEELEGADKIIFQDHGDHFTITRVDGQTGEEYEW